MTLLYLARLASSLDSLSHQSSIVQAAVGKAVYAAFELLGTEETLDPLYQQLAEVSPSLQWRPAGQACDSSTAAELTKCRP